MSTLSAYARAYTALDASAVRRLWPRVDSQALSSAFGQLDSQRVAFFACNVDVEGLTAAATCRGAATYVPKVGSGEPVSVQRVWQFALRKFGDGWLIDSAVTR